MKLLSSDSVYVIRQTKLSAAQYNRITVDVDEDKVKKAGIKRNESDSRFRVLKINANI